MSCPNANSRTGFICCSQLQKHIYISWQAVCHVVRLGETVRPQLVPLPVFKLMSLWGQCSFELQQRVKPASCQNMVILCERTSLFSDACRAIKKRRQLDNCENFKFQRWIVTSPLTSDTVMEVRLLKGELQSMDSGQKFQKRSLQAQMLECAVGRRMQGTNHQTVEVNTVLLSLVAEYHLVSLVEEREVNKNSTCFKWSLDGSEGRSRLCL